MEKTQINNIRDSKVDIIADMIGIKRLIGETYNQLQVNTFHNIEEHN